MSAEQRIRAREFVQKWTEIGLSTTPANHELAERTLRRLYAFAGLAEPRIIWAPCPITAMLSAIVYVAIRASGQENRARDDRALAAIVECMIRGALIAISAPSAHRGVRLAVERAVDAALRVRSMTGTGFAIGVAIIDARSAGPDAALRESLDPPLHKILRALLFEPIRSAIGRVLGELIEPSLNSVGQGLIGSQTRLVRWAGFGSSLSVAQAGLLDYANRVLGIELDRRFLDTIECCGAFWILDGICFAAERATHITLDQGGHLHCEVGPSVGYPAGSTWWHWHGVEVPQSVVEEPETITVETIERMRSWRIRQVMIERYRQGHDMYGPAAFLRDAGARRLDDDSAFGTLWRHDLPEEEPLVMVEVVNHSNEPDGSHKHYFLRVHPELRPILADRGFGLAQQPTARNAVASTFGLYGAEYEPDLET